MIEAPASPAPVVAEPTTTIKPSEALRLGRLTWPKEIRGAMFADGQGACALGAMSVGYWGAPLQGTLSEQAYDFELRRRGLIQALRHDPRGIISWGCECGLEYQAYGMVMHLNDAHRWDTGQIVAWLEGAGL